VPVWWERQRGIQVHSEVWDCTPGSLQNLEPPAEMGRALCTARERVRV
jgi:hypothetical protein